MTPPTLTEDPAISAAAATSGHADQVAPPFAAVLEDGPAAQARAQEVTAAYATPPRQWKDIPLAPLAISREGDWLLHRTALACHPLEQIILEPRAMISDAIRVLWFLAHDPAVWLSIPAMKTGPDGRWQTRSAHERALELEMQIRAWADQHIANEEHALAVTLFYEIYNGTRETRTAVKPSKHHDATKAGN